MRRLDSTSNEAEFGYDDRFEHRWHYVIVVGFAVTSIVTGCILFELFGQGPYSHHNVISAPDRLVVDYKSSAPIGR